MSLVPSLGAVSVYKEASHEKECLLAFCVNCFSSEKYWYSVTINCLPNL